MRLAGVILARAARPVALGMAFAASLAGSAARAEVFGLAAIPPEGAGTLEFNRHIRPILSEKCFFCHGPDQGNLKAGRRLDLEEAARADRDGLRAIVPGAPESSELVRRIHAESPDDVMPPPDSGQSLSDSEKHLLTRWIREGAAYQQHWAFVSPARREAPAPERADWIRNPIDSFVLARLERSGLTPSAEAGKITLCRRLHFDLLGLPPTPHKR